MSNISVSNLRIIEKKGQLLKGVANVNNTDVTFYYHPASDKMTATTLLNSEAELYMANPPHNWQYLICGSIAHHIKKSILH